MKFNYRNAIYSLLDYLKGSKSGKQYNDIAEINNNHESHYAIKKRNEYLSNILRHVIKTVPYYKSLHIADTSLNCFPVVNKNLMRKDVESFYSDSYRGKKNYKSKTSGSTGTPFTVLHDVDKKGRHSADVRYFSQTMGHYWGARFYYLKIWVKENKKSLLVQKMQNIIPVNVFKLDDEKIGKLLQTIKKDSSPKSILGYASALDLLVKYIKQYDIDMSDTEVVSVIAMSESLDNCTKKYMKEYFDCPVVSRYANLENGILAQQTAVSQDNFIANFASYHIEIFNLKEDTLAKEGELGRIVVTDLFNKAMPLIRYDTGDLGVLGRLEKGGTVHYVLEKVEGRKMDAIYDTDGKHVSSHSIGNNMWKYVELNQFQFIQNGKQEYEFRLNSKGDFKREEELVREFKNLLGDDAKIAVTYVDEIPLLSSGKRKKVLSRIKEN